jgi:hypothetical protein
MFEIVTLKVEVEVVPKKEMESPVLGRELRNTGLMSVVNSSARRRNVVPQNL